MARITEERVIDKNSDTENLRKYPQDRVIVGRRNKNFGTDIFRLTERHFLSVYVSNTSKSKTARRKCVVCAKNKKRSESRYECKKCDVGLCINKCFELYHTKEEY